MRRNDAGGNAVSWPLVDVGDAIQFIRGITFKPDQVVEPFSEGSIVVMRTKNVQIAELALDDLISVPKELMKRDEQKLKNGDLLISSANSWELVGKSSFVGELGYEATAGGFISIVRPKKNIIDARYLYHWVMSPKIQHDIRHCGRQTTNISNLDVGRFKELKIPLPPLDEQKRIAAILDKAVSVRRKRQQAIDLADDFLRSVFLDMFGDPVTNPKGLPQVKLTELSDVISGYAFKSAEYIDDGEDSVRLCRGANTLTGYFDWKDTAYWNKEKLAGIQNYKIKSGDVILAMDRPWISSGLKVCVFPENERDTYLVQRVARIRPKKPKYTDFLYASILSKAFEKHCCPTETTVPHISPVELKNFNVLVPDEKLVDKYHDAVVKVRKSKLSMQKSLVEASNAFNSLSQKAFAGEL
nr:restriction endonuclease subunit S [Neptunicella marina]